MRGALTSRGAAASQGRGTVARTAALALYAGAVVAAAVLSGGMLAGCAGGEAAGAAGGAAGAASEATEVPHARFFAGTWRGFVDTAGSAVYGNVEGDEAMLDLVLSADGSVALTPLEGHEDLLDEAGTWEASDETAVTLHLSSGDVELSVVDDATLEGSAAAFGVSGFEVLTFRFR